MNEYLVMYQPPNDNKYYPSLHIWPEILTMLKKNEEVKGRLFVYRFVDEKTRPLRVIHCRNLYWLETMYGYHVEG